MDLPDQLWMSIALDRLAAATPVVPPTVRVDQLRPGDIPEAFGGEALPLIAEGFDDRNWDLQEVARRVLDPGTLRRLITARESGQLVGLTTVHGTPDPSVARLHWLAVAAAHRWAGIGTALVVTACRAAIEDGFAVMKLKTETYRSDAIALYVRLGFTVVAA